MEALRTGTVLRVDHRGRTVLLDGEGRTVRCSVRGTLWRELKRDGRRSVVVGDRVRLTLAGEDEGVIEAVERRRSVLTRRAAGAAGGEKVTAANVDRIVACVSARAPRWKPGFVDRVLCAAERTEIPGSLLVNKVDLLDAEGRAELEAQLVPYRAMAVPVLLTSVATGEGIDALREHLTGRVSTLAGPSGAGKSSLVNRLQPGLRLATARVSRATRKGRHTTTAVTMHPLDFGGFLIDTPGVRAFGFFDLEPRELAWLFRDLRPFAFAEGEADAPRCRFHNCLHRTEPGCEVRRAVDEGRLAGSRYESYLRLLASVEEEQQP